MKIQPNLLRMVVLVVLFMEPRWGQCIMCTYTTVDSRGEGRV
jgi:hypothetical protein